MKNNKQKQSCLYKQKAIYEHIRQSIDEQTRVRFGFYYADNQLYETFKAPTNIHYGYKVVKYLYQIHIDDLGDDGYIKGTFRPIYNRSKAIKI